jgi:hypothetical protein
MVLLQQLRERARLHHVLPTAHLDLALQELPQELHGQVLLRHAPDLGQELIGEDGDVRLLQACGGEEVDDTFRRDSLRDDLPDGVVQLLLWPFLHGRPFCQRCPNSLEERHVIVDTQRILVRYGKGKGFGQLGNPSSFCRAARWNSLIVTIGSDGCRHPLT